MNYNDPAIGLRYAMEDARMYFRVSKTRADFVADSGMAFITKHPLRNLGAIFGDNEGAILSWLEYLIAQSALPTTHPTAPVSDVAASEEGSA